MIVVALVLVLVLMRGELGRNDGKAKFRHMFSNNPAVKHARGRADLPVRLARVWFVVGLPVYLRTVLGGRSGRSARSWRCG